MKAMPVSFRAVLLQPTSTCLWDKSVEYSSCKSFYRVDRCSDEAGEHRSVQARVENNRLILIIIIRDSGSDTVVISFDT